MDNKGYKRCILHSGKYDDKELYIDLFSGSEDNESGIKYIFEYFKKADIRKESFILLKEIVLNDEKSTQIARMIIERLRQTTKLSDQQENLIQDNVAQIKNLFAESELTNYYNIDSTEGGITAYDEILEIFVRVNSGGTILSKSDLMFSLMKLAWTEAEEKFEELSGRINKHGLFHFDKDFVLKTALTLIGSGAKYEVNKFKDERGTKNLKDIESKWTQIESSINWTIDYINEHTFIRGDKALPSYNVLIPVIYYAFIKNQKIDKSDKHDIFVWIYSALLNRNFGGQSDSTIDACIDALKKSNSHFPAEDLNRKIREKNRITDITEDILESDETVILNLIYSSKSGINFDPLFAGNIPTIDHIFSQSKLKKEGVKLQLINNIGNLRYISKDENNKKSDIDLEEYFTDENNSLLNIKEHLIPKDKQLWSISNYSEFITQHRKMILENIKAKLTYLHL